MNARRIPDADQPDARSGTTPQQLAELIAATTDEPLVEGDEPVSVWMLVKSRDVDGDIVWGVRNAGEPFSSEELLGALTGFTESLKRDLSSDWA
ncbi:MAG: hypothetical protein ACRDZS_01915 [Acidimicrobiales bacterium]